MPVRGAGDAGRHDGAADRGSRAGRAGHRPGRRAGFAARRSQAGLTVVSVAVGRLAGAMAGNALRDRRAPSILCAVRLPSANARIASGWADAAERAHVRKGQWIPSAGRPAAWVPAYATPARPTGWYGLRRRCSGRCRVRVSTWRGCGGKYERAVAALPGRLPQVLLGAGADRCPGAVEIGVVGVDGRGVAHGRVQQRSRRGRHTPLGRTDVLPTPPAYNTPRWWPEIGPRLRRCRPGRQPPHCSRLFTTGNPIADRTMDLAVAIRAFGRVPLVPGRAHLFVPRQELGVAPGPPRRRGQAAGDQELVRRVIVGGPFDRQPGRGEDRERPVSPACGSRRVRAGGGRRDRPS